MLNKTHAALISAQGYSSPRRPSVIALPRRLRLAAFTSCSFDSRGENRQRDLYSGTNTQGNGDPHRMAGERKARLGIPVTARLVSGVQQVNTPQFGLLQGGFAAHAQTAEKLSYLFDFFQFSHFRFPKIEPLWLISELVKRNQVFSSPNLWKNCKFYI